MEEANVEVEMGVSQVRETSKKLETEPIACEDLFKDDSEESNDASSFAESAVIDEVLYENCMPSYLMSLFNFFIHFVWRGC